MANGKLVDSRKAMGTAGYVGQNSISFAAALCVAQFFPAIYHAATTEQTAALSALTVALVNLAGKAWRDWRHDRRTLSLPTIAPVLFLLLVPALWTTGCASSGGQGQNVRPVLKRTMLDAEGKPVSVVEVSLEGDLISQGCVAYDVSEKGDVSFVLSQYGSSDWSSVRGIVSIVPETVAVALNPISTPIDAVVRSLAGRPPMEPPTKMENPCAVLYETQTE